MTPLQEASKEFIINTGGACADCIKPDIDSFGIPHCTYCEFNITYDNPAVIRKAMGDKWDGMQSYLLTILFEISYEQGCKAPNLYIPTPDFTWKDTACMAFDILTTPLLLLQAANAYMEGE